MLSPFGYTRALTNSLIILFMLARGSVKSSSSVGGGHSSSCAFDIVRTFKFAILCKLFKLAFRSSIVAHLPRSIDQCHKKQTDFILYSRISFNISVTWFQWARAWQLFAAISLLTISFYYCLFILFFRGRKCILLDYKKKWLKSASQCIETHKKNIDN